MQNSKKLQKSKNRPIHSENAPSDMRSYYEQAKPNLEHVREK